VSDKRSSVILIDENVERGTVWGGHWVLVLTASRAPYRRGYAYNFGWLEFECNIEGHLKLLSGIQHVNFGGRLGKKYILS
jgi:hypothetical protein